ncbi:MAG: hypothetical protein WCF90_01410 [Methanomicrobiales archaeon]
MNQLGIRDVTPTGQLLMDGKNVATMTYIERLHMRWDIIGYIFQTFYLIPLLSAYENVKYLLSCGTSSGTQPVRRGWCSNPWGLMRR